MSFLRLSSTGRQWLRRLFSTTFREDPELQEFIGFMDNLKNYERSGVPRGAGTDSEDGFDLGRMRRMMDLLGSPQSKFQAIHVAGTKGKGSTAEFISNILRAEGYSVGSYTSPHIRTIRERISLGRLSEPVSARTLNCLFQRIKKTLDEVVKLENPCISHFEVLTAVAFSLFAQEKVDIAVIEAGLGGARDATNIISSSGLVASVITTIGEEHLAALGGSLESIALAKSGIIKHERPLILGGPFLPHIEQIIRDKASLMSAPVLSAYDPGNKFIVKGIRNVSGNIRQSCDILVKIKGEFPMFIQLFDVQLKMIGSHHLQNAMTAVCTALCLRGQGWKISDGSIRAGLEQTRLVGRSQFLLPQEAAALGVQGATILLDGAHTKESAKALVDTIRMTFPEDRIVFVVAMASDKDHAAFARELLLVNKLEAVFLTEVKIAGDKLRTTPSKSLKECWIQASTDVGVDVIDYGSDESELHKNQLNTSLKKLKMRTILFSENSMMDSLKIGDQILNQRVGDRSGIIIVTGSLHVVSSVLDSLYP